MHSLLLADLVTLLVVSIGVLYASHYVRLPPVVGFLISGVLLGPHGLGLIEGVEQVEQLAEIGVVLLLFTIGLEFSMAELLRMRRAVLLGGSLQIVGVTLAVYVVLVQTGIPSNGALFMGLTASLSSTAVVLRLLQQSAQVDAPHGRMSLAILVHQDLMIVPMMLLIPVLAGASGGLLGALGAFVLQAVAILAILMVLARFVVPQMLDRVVHTRNRDLFLLTILALCLAIAYVASLAGLSLALGAFLAGLLVSESEYSHQALADILPFRDVFASFFFISIGMLLDIQLAIDAPLLLIALVVGVLAVKVVAGAIAVLAVGLPLRPAVITGMAVSQVGEFSFVLAGAGMTAGLVDDVSYQWFVATAVATIGLTPFMLAWAPKAASLLHRLPLPHSLQSRGRAGSSEPAKRPLENHLVVIGYGINGRNVCRAASVAGIPHVAVDMNPALASAEKARGVPIHYGDATREAFLQHLGVGRARAVVIVLSDAATTRQVTSLVRGLNPNCTVIARTRYVREVEALRALGADTVVPEELETSVEIVSRVLTGYLVPRSEIEAFISEIRRDNYTMWRTPLGSASSLHDLRQTLTDVEITTMRVEPGSKLAGQRLIDSDLRRVFGVTVVAIRRGEQLIPNPRGEEAVQPNDLLVVLGLGEEIVAARELVGTNGTARASSAASVRSAG
jgi:CPA2 family monovalent cation:H+ antiporter-2